MDPLTIIGLGFVIANFAYHRLKTEEPEIRKLVDIQLPRFEEGTVPPILYGKVLTRPGIPWYGLMEQAESAANNECFKYTGSVHLMLGIPFYNGDTRLHGVFVGGTRLPLGGSNGPPLNFLPLTNMLPNINGGPDQFVSNHLETAGAPGGDPSFIEFEIEFADGNSSQDLFAGAGSRIVDDMYAAGVDPDDIPSFRGSATMLCRLNLGSSSIPAIGAEISTYPRSFGEVGAGFPALSHSRIGVECNPIHVLVDLLSGFHDGSGQLGKLGINISAIDVSSFNVAAATLLAEGHGYSRVIDTGRSVDDVIMEILRQIDGVLYEDQRTGKIKIKLIRGDYDPRTIPQINVDNCEGLLNFAAAGWTSVVNKVRVTFTDREANYQSGSAAAHNQANAVGQDGEVNEIILDFPGVCTQAHADYIAGRELAARSRPLAKFTAIVDRSFYRVSPGDAVSVTWTDANISGMIFRVGQVGMSTADSNMLRLELIQDFFYVHRGSVNVGGLTAPFSGVGGLLLAE